MAFTFRKAGKADFEGKLKPSIKSASSFPTGAPPIRDFRAGDKVLFEGEDFIGPSSIVSEEAIGIPALVLSVVDAGGIVSAEAVGPPGLVVIIFAAGDIPSEETFGSPTLDKFISGAGDVSSEEAVGSPTLLLVISPEGISSGEQFGLSALAPAILAGGITSGEVVPGPLLKVQKIFEPTVRGMVTPKGFSFGLKKLPEKTDLSVGIKSIFGLRPLSPRKEEPAKACEFGTTLFPLYTNLWPFRENEYITEFTFSDCAWEVLNAASSSLENGEVTHAPWAATFRWGYYDQLFFTMWWVFDVETGICTVRASWDVGEVPWPTMFNVTITWGDGQGNEVVQVYDFSLGGVFE